MRTIESVMIESGRFVGKKGSWFHLQRKSSGDWGNPMDGTRRRILSWACMDLGLYP